MAHIRQSRPDSGLGFQVKVLKACYVVPSWLGRGVTVAEVSRGVDWAGIVTLNRITLRACAIAVET